MKKQKEAVFDEIVAIKNTSTFNSPVELTKEERQKVQANLLAGFNNGDIEFQGDLTDKTKLSAYVSGLVSNWLRKDKRLNGNTTYVPANPGTRTGSNDDGVKAMRQLLTQIDDPDAKKEIQAELEKKLAELKPKPTIDVDQLPDHLKALVPANAVVVKSSTETTPAS